MFNLKKITGLQWLWLSGFIFVADFSTKWWMQAQLTLHERIPIFSFFNLTLVYNKGAAFSLLSHQTGWQRWFLSVVAIIVCGMIISWLKTAKHAPSAHKISLALILGGALGNLIDRLRYGYVIDFLDFHWATWHFPAFNIADSAITCGAVLLLLTLWQKK